MNYLNELNSLWKYEQSTHLIHIPSKRAVRCVQKRSASAQEIVHKFCTSTFASAWEWHYTAQVIWLCCAHARHCRGGTLLETWRVKVWNPDSMVFFRVHSLQKEKEHWLHTAEKSKNAKVSLFFLALSAYTLEARSPRKHLGGPGVGDRPPPPKTYESNFTDHDFVQFGKQHIKTNSFIFILSHCSRYKAILLSIVLSQQCCEVYFIPLTVAKPLRDLTTKNYWNRSTP